jgi:putative phosphoribosyl transferase
MPDTTVVHLEAAGVVLEAELTMPPRAHAVVVLADASRPARFVQRHRSLAEQLQDNGYATVLTELLTQPEAWQDERTLRLRLDAALLAGRINGIARTLTSRSDTRGLPVGLFGTASAANAMLLATATSRMGAVVCCHARPNLSTATLARVTTPALFLVDDTNATEVETNERAAASIAAPRLLQPVPDSGDIDIFKHTIDWYAEHLAHRG